MLYGTPIKTASICWILPSRILNNSSRQRVLGVLHGRLYDRAIGEGKIGEPACVVDEPCRHHEAALFVHQKKATVANAIVVAVIAELELLRATQVCDGDDFHEVGIVSCLQTVLDAIAIVVELGEENSVIELKRAEIAVDKRDHAGARASRLRRN